MNSVDRLFSLTMLGLAIALMISVVISFVISGNKEEEENRHDR